jgi:hypothetical protein
MLALERGRRGRGMVVGITMNGDWSAQDIQ